LGNEGEDHVRSVAHQNRLATAPCGLPWRSEAETWVLSLTGAEISPHEIEKGTIADSQETRKALASGTQWPFCRILHLRCQLRGCDARVGSCRMGSERVVTPALGVFLAVVGGVMLAALDSRLRRPQLATALDLLADGDLEGIERRKLLQAVLAEGRSRPERPARLAAAMAAVQLGDGPAFERLAAGLAEGGEPLRAEDLASAERFLAVEPVLGHLCAGMLAADRGDRTAAREAFVAAASAAALWDMPVAKAVALAGVERLR
jgi:hypothetical protein